MKKILFIFGCAMMILSATTAKARTAGFGVTAGMNISKIDWSNIKQADPEPEKGWYAGVTGMFSVPLLGFGFDGGIVYSQEGVNLGMSDLDTEIAHFVSIPVHLRYDFKFYPIDDIFVPYLYAGPQFNFALNNLDFGDVLNQSLEATLKKSNNWRLDFGLGCILFDRVQLSYSYGIPMGDRVDVNLGETFVDKYKMGAHRMGVAYYF